MTKSKCYFGKTAKTFLGSALGIAISILVIGSVSYAVYRGVFASGPEVPVGVTEESTTTPATKDLKQRQVSFKRPANETLPQEVRNWVENSLKLDMGDFANAKEFDGKQYLFVRSGTGGFNGERLVQIIDVIVVEQEEVVVKVKFTKPSPAQQTPDNLYDLVYVEATGLQARFLPTGDDAFSSITSLTGIDHLPTITAQSRSIKVFTPSPNEVVGRKFNVSGVANVYEANVRYRLLDAKRGKLIDGFKTAGDMFPGFTETTVVTTNWVSAWRYFTFDLTVPETIVADADLILELFWESPKDGGEECLIVIPLKFELR